MRLRGRWSMKNGFAKLFSDGLALSPAKRRPDCQPEYFVAFVPRPSGSSRHSYWVSSFTRGSL